MRNDIIDMLEQLDTGKSATIQPSGTETGTFFLHLFDDDGDLVGTSKHDTIEDAKQMRRLWITPEDYDDAH